MIKDMFEIPSPYFQLRGDDEVVSRIIIKTSSLGLKDLAARMMKNTTEEGCHFIVNGDGHIMQCVEPESKIKFFTAFEDTELVGIILTDGTDDRQMQGLQDLCVHLCINYSIPLNRIDFTDENFPIFEFLNSLGAAVLGSLLTVDQEG